MGKLQQRIRPGKQRKREMWARHKRFAQYVTQVEKKRLERKGKVTENEKAEAD
jgi:hypothetical protein